MQGCSEGIFELEELDVRLGEEKIIRSLHPGEHLVMRLLIFDLKCKLCGSKNGIDKKRGTLVLLIAQTVK